MSAELRPDSPGFKSASAFATAVAWLSWIHRHPDDCESREAFRAWRESAREFAVASGRAENVWRASGELAAHPVVAAWRDKARKSHASHRGRWVAAVAAVGIISAVGMYGVLSGPRGLAALREIVNLDSAEIPEISRTEITARGERRTVKLTDATQITINTASEVRIEYSSRHRNVRLVKGEALFEVAKDAQRAFIVSAVGRQVIALGTSFAMRIDQDNLQVTLLEGRVAVRSQSTPGGAMGADRGSVELAPGQQYIAQGRKSVTVRGANVAQAMSWQNGWIILDRDTVRDAIAEVGRYTQQSITADDPRLAQLRVSGTFRTGDLNDFIEALTKIHPITVDRSDSSEIKLLWKK